MYFVTQIAGGLFGTLRRSQELIMLWQFLSKEDFKWKTRIIFIFLCR